MTDDKRYTVNEIFYSLQGEGVRAGTANVFVRFAGCNLNCNGSSDGEAYQPVCDTEFVSGRSLTADQILDEIKAAARVGSCKNIILTGGEPALQINRGPLVARLKAAGYYLACESNGTHPLPDALDWVCVSPKTAEHTLTPQRVDELKYVRPAGMGIPRPKLSATHYLLSPAFVGGAMSPGALAWCMNLVLQHPTWRLSVQQHKTWQVR